MSESKFTVMIWTMNLYCYSIEEVVASLLDLGTLTIPAIYSRQLANNRFLFAISSLIAHCKDEGGGLGGRLILRKGTRIQLHSFQMVFVSNQIDFIVFSTSFPLSKNQNSRNNISHSVDIHFLGQSKPLAMARVSTVYAILLITP